VQAVNKARYDIPSRKSKADTFQNGRANLNRNMMLLLMMMTMTTTTTTTAAAATTTTTTATTTSTTTTRTIERSGVLLEKLTRIHLAKIVSVFIESIYELLCS
jgi:hypothetical protein